MGTHTENREAKAKDKFMLGTGTLASSPRPAPQALTTVLEPSVVPTPHQRNFSLKQRMLQRNTTVKIELWSSVPTNHLGTPPHLRLREQSRKEVKEWKRQGIRACAVRLCLPGRSGAKVSSSEYLNTDNNRQK